MTNDTIEGTVGIHSVRLEVIPGKSKHRKKKTLYLEEVNPDPKHRYTITRVWNEYDYPRTKIYVLIKKVD